MGLRDIYNSTIGGVGKMKGSLSSIFGGDTINYQKPYAEPIGPVPPDMFQKAGMNANKKYGVDVPPNLLRAIQQQESSGKVDKNDLNLTMGFTPIAKEHLGNDYLPPDSVDNVVQNAANYLASRARGTLDSGEKYDLSTPENYSKWYVQKYVGLYPGESRMISGELVPYEKIVNSFEKLLNQYNK